MIAGLHAAVEGEAMIWQDEYRLMKADGAAVIVLDSAYLIRDEVGSFHDVTAEHEAEARR